MLSSIKSDRLSFLIIRDAITLTPNLISMPSYDRKVTCTIKSSSHIVKVDSFCLKFYKETKTKTKIDFKPKKQLYEPWARCFWKSLICVSLSLTLWWLKCIYLHGYVYGSVCLAYVLKQNDANGKYVYKSTTDWPFFKIYLNIYLG